MDIELLPGDRRPLFVQIADAVRAAIARNDFRPGDSLPPVRTLARHVGVHANTILQAYRQLAADGAVRSQRGRGTFVSFRPVGDAERRVLADEVAERARRDAFTHGLTPHDLSAALDRAEGRARDRGEPRRD